MHVGCVWILDLVKEMEMKKLDDPTVQDHWIIYLFHFHFHFLFPLQIPDSNAALTSQPNQLLISTSDALSCIDSLFLITCSGIAAQKTSCSRNRRLYRRKKTSVKHVKRFQFSYISPHKLISQIIKKPTYSANGGC